MSSDVKIKDELNSNLTKLNSKIMKWPVLNYYSEKNGNKISFVE
jgi:hypothetical protein